MLQICKRPLPGHWSSSPSLRLAPGGPRQTPKETNATDGAGRRTGPGEEEQGRSEGHVGTKTQAGRRTRAGNTAWLGSRAAHQPSSPRPHSH
ncbi:hypothetical protein E2C01_076959 [Portunus trituberculatus]|uniref:Uncharacterized protein n=1 Tax=Portunus trituberculatus TaxID=210409 RepID=A0A5B7IA48_PORTR|nr:hypothetical protein [Portunus trituberculatus]